MGHGARAVNGRVGSSEQSFLIATLSSLEAEEFNFQRLLNNLGFLIHAPSTIHPSVMIIYLYSPSKRSAATTVHCQTEEWNRWVSPGICLSVRLPFSAI